MSIVPIPGTNGEFLAVQKFFKMFQWEEAKVVHVKPLADARYQVTDILHLPYIHRFDLLPVGDRCTSSAARWPPPSRPRTIGPIPASCGWASTPAPCRCR
jgi:hypothetical protein